MTERWVYVINIDIKDGWYDIIHAFSDQADADAYLAWQQEHVGDHAYMVKLPLLDIWQPPDNDTVQTGLFA